MANIKTVEFALQSLMIEVAERRFPEPGQAAKAVALWSSLLDLPSGDLSARTNLHLRIKQVIDDFDGEVDDQPVEQ